MIEPTISKRSKLFDKKCLMVDWLKQNYGDNITLKNGVIFRGNYKDQKNIGIYCKNPGMPYLVHIME